MRLKVYCSIKMGFNLKGSFFLVYAICMLQGNHALIRKTFQGNKSFALVHLDCQDKNIVITSGKACVSYTHFWEDKKCSSRTGQLHKCNYVQSCSQSISMDLGFVCCLSKSYYAEVEYTCMKDSDNSFTSTTPAVNVNISCEHPDVIAITNIEGGYGNQNWTNKKGALEQIKTACNNENHCSLVLNVMAMSPTSQPTSQPPHYYIKVNYTCNTAKDSIELCPSPNATRYSSRYGTISYNSNADSEIENAICVCKINGMHEIDFPVDNPDLQDYVSIIVNDQERNLISFNESYDSNILGIAESNETLIIYHGTLQKLYNFTVLKFAYKALDGDPLTIFCNTTPFLETITRPSTSTSTGKSAEVTTKSPQMTTGPLTSKSNLNNSGSDGREIRAINSGDTAGIAVGLILLLVTVAGFGIFIVIYRRRKYRNSENEKRNTKHQEMNSLDKNESSPDDYSYAQVRNRLGQSVDEKPKESSTDNYCFAQSHKGLDQKKENTEYKLFGGFPEEEMNKESSNQDDYTMISDNEAYVSSDKDLERRHHENGSKNNFDQDYSVFEHNTVYGK